MAPDNDADAPRLFEVDRFEHLSASPERILLRVDGRYLDRPGRRILDATLFVDDGLAVRRHAALPDPTSASYEALDGWLWRAAFAIPAAYLTDARTSFALEARPGTLLALPDPRAVALASITTPLSARAARTARRYAAAIAVMVTVAVAPGVLPANARTEIIKVRRADGSVVYLTPDGSPVAQVPANADVVDETGGASTTVASDGAPSAHTVVPSESATAQKQQPAQQRPSVAAGPAEPQQAEAAPQPTPQPQQRPAHRRRARAHRNRASGHVRFNDVPSPAARDTQLVTTPELAAQRAQSAPALESLGSIGDPTDGATQLKSLRALGTGPAEAPSAPALEPLDTILPASAPALEPLTPQPGSAPQLEPLTPQPGSAPQLESLTPQPGSTPQLEPLAPPPTGPALQPLGSPQPNPATAPKLQPIPTAAPRGAAQARSGSRAPAVRPTPPPPARAFHPTTAPQLVRPAPAPTTSSPAVTAPAPSGNPAPFDTLPGPSAAVPSFVISHFQIPPFLLPIYQAAATEYGIKWEVLAAINEIETNYGRDLSVSSAGALGWMQFMPDTWKTYGVDANRDGKRDPYNPVDAIFAAARYLKAAGGDKDVRQSIFAYNHASWYVDSVMLRAQLIAAYPQELIGALTGLTQGRFPIAAPARYAGEVTPGKPPPSSADVPQDPQQGVDIYSRAGAPVVAVSDGVVKRIGRSTKKGLYVVLQDAYGNEYTYSGLGEVAQRYPVPNIDAVATFPTDTVPQPGDPAPNAPATSGSQTVAQSPAGSQPAPAPARPIATKLRLFAHPGRPHNHDVGGADQIFEAQQAGDGFVAYDGYFADPLGLNSTNSTLHDLRPGAAVIASTVLGRLGSGGSGKPPSIHFEVRPAGKGAPSIDPRPVLDGWRLLESTQAYGPSGKKALSKDAGPVTVGQAMLLPKPLLEERVLSDTRLKIYAAGRQDIKTGQLDRRVLEVLEYLADAGLNPTVSALRSGVTARSGSEAEHASGDAVDITEINGIPIKGHQDRGGIAERAVRKLMELQGTVRPHEVISLLALGQNTLAQPDHADRIHVGFQPLFGDNAALGKQALSVLGPQQWDQLASRLGQIGNPSVPTVPSKYALPDH